MVDARSLWQFEPRTARALRDFILNPAGGVQPDRLEALLPGAGEWLDLSAEGRAALSKALMQALDLDEHTELDLDQPLHRSALLPGDGLQAWARTVEAMALAPRLRRVILQSELQQLQPLLSEAQWVLALNDGFQSLAHGVLDTQALNEQSLDAVLALFDNVGWRLIESAWSELPRSVNQRACLKLPLHQGPSPIHHSSSGSARALVECAYAHAVATWSPDWDQAWTQRMAA